MRITPTREQMAYLASIGASKPTSSQPKSATAAPTAQQHTTPRHSGSPAIQWWAIILVIIVLLLAIVGFAQAQTTQPAQNEVVAGGQVDHQDDFTMDQWLDAIETDVEMLRESIGQLPTRDQFINHEHKVTQIEQELNSLQHRVFAELSTEREHVDSQTQFVQAKLDELKAAMTALSTGQVQNGDQIAALIAAATERADAEVSEPRRLGTGWIDREFDNLRAGLEQNRPASTRTLIWVTVINALGVGLIVIGRILMEQRIREVERSVISRLSVIAAIPGDLQEPSPERAKSMGLATTGRNLTIEPTRPRSQPLPTPVAQMQAIIACASRFRHIRVKPVLASGPWEFGLATNKGNVRSENQDFGLCFQTDGHDVLIVADGCGGVPHGQKAAYLATVSAAVSVVRAYGMAKRWHTPHVKDVAARALMDAAHRLTVEGDKLNVSDIRGGLRTTLIVVIANKRKREVGFAYIGDGGGCIVKSTGEVHRFLDPQKANGFALNVLAASLGPVMEGQPVTGLLKRETGDLLIVGTDGVFDRVESTFPKDVLRGCIQYRGDLQTTAEHIVQELASFQDGAGYVCDDNVTVALMGDGTSPKLSPGFWSPIDEHSARQVDEKRPEPAACAKEQSS